MENIQAKRMRYDEDSRERAERANDKLNLAIYQNHLTAQCIEDNYINKLLDSTRSFIQKNEEYLVESQAISSAINTFGLRKQPILNIFEDNSNPDDGPSTSTSARNSSSASSSSSLNSPVIPNLESAAIDHAISQFGLRNEF